MQEFRTSALPLMEYYYDMGMVCRLREVSTFWTRQQAVEFVAAKNDPVEDPTEQRYADVYCTIVA